MNNKRTRTSNNNSNWNNSNQNPKNSSNNIVSSGDIQTIHKLNPPSNNNYQQTAQNMKSNQTEFLNEIEMGDCLQENFNNEADNTKESFKEYKLSAEEIESIIKRGQTKITLNTLANKMMEDLRGKFIK